MIFNFFICSVYKISQRHQLLRETISTRQDENYSYEMVTYLNNCLTPIFLIFLCLEILLFYTYTNMVTTFYSHDHINNELIRHILGRKSLRAIQKIFLQGYASSVWKEFKIQMITWSSNCICSRSTLSKFI